MRKARYRQPVVIRVNRKARGDDPHHNTSWKIAYADLMTAMMAFFLLLWLYAALAPKQKIDIANYFSPTIGISGAADAEKGRLAANFTSDGIIKRDLKQGPQLTKTTSSVEQEDISSFDDGSVSGPGHKTSDRDAFMAISEKIKQVLKQERDFNEKNTLLMEKTKNSLVISLIEDPLAPMFLPQSPGLTQSGSKQLIEIAKIIAPVHHTISISSHTASNGVAGNPQYSNWELSVDRANAVRRLLVAENIDESCLMNISGEADQSPLIPAQPENPRNNRIIVTITTGECYARAKN